jgi:hypothetical protein
MHTDIHPYPHANTYMHTNTHTTHVRTYLVYGSMGGHTADHLRVDDAAVLSVVVSVGFDC